MTGMNRMASALGAALLLASAVAGAQQAPEGERPWAQGIPAEKQRAALELFGQGNALLKDSLFVQAAARYREALGHWDHPAIHYNLVLALLNLDQPVEVHQHLEAAMRFGEAPLDADKFAQARAYRRLVEAQLSRVDIGCEVPDARVVMDGRFLFTAPGRHQAWVRAGPHTVVASADGFLTREISQSLPAGETTRIALELFRAGDLTAYRRRFPVWLPWSTLAAGAAVAAAGGALHVSARDDFSVYDRGIIDCGGCVPAAEVTQGLQRGHTRQQLAIGAYAVGGGALAAGALLLYFNKPEAVQLSQEALEKERAGVSLGPLLGPDGAGLRAQGRF